MNVVLPSKRGRRPISIFKVNGVDGCKIVNEKLSSTNIIHIILKQINNGGNLTFGCPYRQVCIYITLTNGFKNLNFRKHFML